MNRTSILSRYLTPLAAGLCLLITTTLHGQDSTVTATVAAGKTVTLIATAGGSPAPSFEWFKNGARLSGATNNTLRFNAITTADGGTYTTLATNPYGSDLSHDAVLIVTEVVTPPPPPPPPPGPTPAPPAFTLHPVSQSVASKSTVVFTVAATGVPSPTYQWQKNGSPISGATDATLTLTNVNNGSRGTYTAVATNTVGSAISQPAELTVGGGGGKK